MNRVLDGVYIGATWRMRLHGLMRPYVKLVRRLVTGWEFPWSHWRNHKALKAGDCLREVRPYHSGLVITASIGGSSQCLFVSRITRAVKGGIFMTFGEWVDCVMERSRVYCGRLCMFGVRNSTLLLASNDILWQRYALCWVSSSIQCFTRVFLCHCCWYAIMMPPQFIQLAITSISVFILMPFLELLCIFTKTAHQNFSSSIFHQQHCLKDCT